MDAQVTEILLGIASTVLAIIGLLLRKELGRLKDRLNKSDEAEKKDDLANLGVSIICDKRVHDIVAEARVVNKASRAYVIRFHNGSFFTGKQPVWKMTCTHESTASGVSYETLNIQGLPASSVLEVIAPFWGEKSCGVSRIDKPTLDIDLDPRRGIYLSIMDELDDSMTKQFLIGQNIRKMVNIPLLDITDGRVIGLFGLDYNYDTDSLPADLTQVRHAANQVSYLITRETEEGGC